MGKESLLILMHSENYVERVKFLTAAIQNLPIYFTDQVQKNQSSETSVMKDLENFPDHRGLI